MRYMYRREKRQREERARKEGRGKKNGYQRIKVSSIGEQRVRGGRRGR